MFGYYITKLQEINTKMFGKLTGILSTFVENSTKNNIKKSLKKLLHFPKKYTKLRSVAITTKTTNKKAH